MSAVRIVVVCHANVARSVAAAQLLDGATDERGVRVELRTAGTHATEGQPASARTRFALSSCGIGTDVADAHRAHLLGADDIAWADLVVAMEGSQVRFLRRAYPDAAARVATIAALAGGLPADERPLVERLAAMGLSSLDATDECDVADPAGGDEAAHARTVEELVERCAALLARLAGDGQPVSP